MDELDAFLAAIVESSDDAIIGLSLQGRILSWNRGAEQIYGYRSTQTVGQSVPLLSLPERTGEVHNKSLRGKSCFVLARRKLVALHDPKNSIQVNLA